LIEDVPGVEDRPGKSLAKSIDCKFTRIQLTPDLLLSDVLGVSIFNRRHKNSISNPAVFAMLSCR
jgi:MoxR-like ATPase